MKIKYYLRLKSPSAVKLSAIAIGAAFALAAFADAAVQNPPPPPPLLSGTALRNPPPPPTTTGTQYLPPPPMTTGTQNPPPPPMTTGTQNPPPPSITGTAGKIPPPPLTTSTGAPLNSGSIGAPIAIEGYREEVALTTAASGTATVQGIAVLALNTVSGSNVDTVEVTFAPLASGTKDIKASLISSGSTVTLGQISIPPVATGSTAMAVQGAPRKPIHLVFGPPDHPLPAGVAVSDIASVSVVDDSTGNTILKGDFTQVATVGTISILDRLPIVAGTAAPKAAGRMEINGVQRNGRKNAEFRLMVTGLPSTVSASLAINGTDVGNYTVDSNGSLLIVGREPQPSTTTSGTATPVKPAPQALPATVEIFGITSVLLHYGNGTELFHVRL